jgi:GNAT superfamily N-acetyltransferase
MPDLDLIVIVPSRHRPERARACVESIAATRTRHIHVVVAVDGDPDPGYDMCGLVPDVTVVRYDTHAGMVATLNRAASDAVGHAHAVAFLGDDHRTVSLGWDDSLLTAVADVGIGYGNDLVQGEVLPTAVVMTANIVTTLGYMAPPALTHLYVDDFWRDLGLGAECLTYLPDVVIEHEHPTAGTAVWDEQYRRVNSAAMYERDRVAYVAYRRDELSEAVAKVKALRG